MVSVYKRIIYGLLMVYKPACTPPGISRALPNRRVPPRAPPAPAATPPTPATEVAMVSVLWKNSPKHARSCVRVFVAPPGTPQHRRHRRITHPDQNQPGRGRGKGRFCFLGPSQVFPKSPCSSLLEWCSWCPAAAWWRCDRHEPCAAYCAVELRHTASGSRNVTVALTQPRQRPIVQE